MRQPKTKWQYFLRSTYKNVIVKRKFMPFFYVLFSRDFQAKLNVIHALTAKCTETTFKDIPIKDIVYGHQIFYPKYVMNLLLDDSTPILPIKVVKDGDVYRIADGNHRFLPAELRARRAGRDSIVCEVRQ